MSTLLRAADLAVGARLGSRQVEVLRHLDIALAPGQVLGVVGESGAGKSMLGRTIAQALPPGFSVTGGTLHYGAEDLVAMPPGRRRTLLGRDITFIPQEPMAALNPVLTVGQQLGEHLRRLGLSDRRARAMALLDAVRLRDPRTLLTRYPHQLSGGMCQRVLIAMAFASQPRLVIADEPTTALDVTVQAQVIRLIRDLQAGCETAVIFITHDLRLAARICDDLLVLYAGRAVEQGPVRRVLATPGHPYTQCLQLAAPALDGGRRGLYSLPGQQPGLRDAAPAGCRFAPRCPVAQDDCSAAEPPLLDGAACFHSAGVAAITVPPARPAPPATPDGALLGIENLGRVFTSRRMFRRHRVVAVQDASFTVGRAEFVGLVGESGSGKSTVARLVMGLERPTCGRILLEGAAANRAGRLRAMQMVFQDPQSALNPRRTVADIVSQAMRAARTSATAREARAHELLKQVGLAPEIATRYPAQLSGGQRQRVNIARALCVVPKLLVADEIVSGLDVSVQAQVLELLLELREKIGFAMLFISHDLAVVKYLCSRVLVMQQGKIVEQGDTETVFAEPAHAYTRELLEAVP